jgi:hypothetical protein
MHTLTQPPSPGAPYLDFEMGAFVRQHEPLSLPRPGIPSPQNTLSKLFTVSPRAAQWRNPLFSNHANHPHTHPKNKL